MELKSYKQLKPVNEEGTRKKRKDGVDQLFDLITNATDSTFPMKPQARMVLLDLAPEFNVIFHELFVMEVKQHRAQIVSIDAENDTEVIRWERTRKSKSVDIDKLLKYSVSDTSLRKFKPTSFFLPQPDAKN